MFPKTPNNITHKQIQFAPKKKKEKGPGFIQSFLNLFSGNNKQRTLPVCKNPFFCPIANNTKHPNYKTHTNEFVHVCKYGNECKMLDDPEHMRTFKHMDKKDCQYGQSCCKQTDPKHRLEFRHAGLWDYMLPCTKNPCQHTGNTNHCLRYTHGNYQEPSFDKIKFKGVTTATVFSLSHF